MLNVLKIRLFSKEKWQMSRVNDPKTIRIMNMQFSRYRFYMSMSVACVFPLFIIHEKILSSLFLRQLKNFHLMVLSPHDSIGSQFCHYLRKVITF